MDVLISLTVVIISQYVYQTITLNTLSICNLYL